jgi:hypothetical protein
LGELEKAAEQRLGDPSGSGPELLGAGNPAYFAITCNFLAAKAGEMQKFRQFDLHNIACRTYKVDRGRQRTFWHFSAQYGDRIFRFVNDNTISISTVAGRQKITCVAGHYQPDLMDLRGKCYIACVCNIDNSALIETGDLLDVGLGIVNIATNSNGKSFTGEAIEKVRPIFRPRARVLSVAVAKLSSGRASSRANSGG